MRVVGRVQGVGFRWWTARRAKELGLRGTVRNRPDGSVEVSVEGAPAGVDRLIELLSHGPTGARVDGVEPLEASDQALPVAFEIIG
jgi:acylphosphatase